MTLQEAKDRCAVKMGYVDYYHLASQNYLKVPLCLDIVIELYARSKWDECYLKTCDGIKIKTLFTFDAPKPEFKL